MSSFTKTSASPRTQGDDVQLAAWTVDELRSIWERQQLDVYARMDVIERAITALTDGRLTSELRRDAERAAHTLAGSLGTFGFVDASEAARELELELTHPTAGRAPALSALLQGARGGLEGPVLPCPDIASVSNPSVLSSAN
jgi:Hpt domain